MIARLWLLCTWQQPAGPVTVPEGTFSSQFVKIKASLLEHRRHFQNTGFYNKIGVAGPVAQPDRAAVS
jgi:hypothetical protein